MKALSVQPYWATAILQKAKTVECRTWKTVNLNLPRFRLHPYAASSAASSMRLASNSSGLRLPSAEWIRTRL